MLTIEEKSEKMRLIREEVWHLKSSPLYEYRMKNKYFPVIGEGNHNPYIVFIGEAPGENEALTARPFCGKSGKIIDEMLDSIKLNREDVYITNLIKDRPPENRDPNEEEIKIYAPFLDRQLEILEPRVIATLGKYSCTYIMKKFGLEEKIKDISEIHGKEFDAKAYYGDINGNIKIIPIYHPAIEFYESGGKDTLLNDFSVLQRYI